MIRNSFASDAAYLAIMLYPGDNVNDPADACNTAWQQEATLALVNNVNDPCRLRIQS